jgi:DNA processing protein
MNESEACVAFNLTDKIGSVRALSAREKYGSFSLAWENYPSKVSRAGGEIDVEAEYARAEKCGIKILTIADSEYPEFLRKTPGCPLVLYVKGNCGALSKEHVAIIGTRRATAYGIEQAEKFGYDLSKNGFGIVSGLALGIDAAAHRGALDAKGITVGVIGSALDRFYPEENRVLARKIVENGGAVVSQFPLGRYPDTTTFPMRNAVVAALSMGVIAIESPHRSGTLITTAKAADMGRTVMALPGRVDSASSAGCLALIRDGAVLVRSSRDVMEALRREIKIDETELRGEVSKRKAVCAMPAVTIEESLVMRHLTGDGISMDELVSRTGLSVQRVSSLCMMLRMKERLRFLPGNRVALPRDS